MYRQTQCSFSGGVLDRELMGRTDLAKYYSGASKIENLLVRRQGNLAKRRGTDFCADLTGILGRTDGVLRPLGRHRLLPISREREQGCYALLADRRAFLLDSKRGILCTDGVWRRSAPAYDAPAQGGATELAEDYTLPLPVGARIGNAFYATLADAVAAHEEGDTIVMGEDAVISANMTLKGTLDLNGYTLSLGGNYSITFTTERSGTACGIVSRAAGAKIEVPDTLTLTNSNQLLKHTKGALTLSDFECVHPFTGSQACILLTSAADADDTVLMLRLRLSGKGGYGLVRVTGTIANQEEGPSQSMPYGGWPGCVSVYGCELDWEYAASATTKYYAFSRSGTTANERKVSFFSGYLRCEDSQYRPAARVGLFVYGGALDCTAIGDYTSTAGVTSRIMQGLASHTFGPNYMWTGESGGETVTAELHVDENQNPVKYRIGETDYFSYNVTGDIPYTPDRNAWEEPDYGGETETDEPPGDESPRSLTAGDAPYCIAIPYSDAELDTLDTFQSGDTIFMAHASHAPACLRFLGDGPAIMYSRLRFNSAAWSRPAIIAVENRIHNGKSESSVQGGDTYVTTVSYATTPESCTRTTRVTRGTTVMSTSTTGLPVRKVRYVATYVKNGVESAPSNPVEVVYGAPWEEGGTVTLTMSRGANDAEPDWYNVYKEDSSGYGLVGSTGRPQAVSDRPQTAIGYAYAQEGEADGKAYAPGFAATVTLDGATLLATEKADVLGGVPRSVASEATVAAEGALGKYRLAPGAGGMLFGAETAMFSYGKESGVRADSATLAFDAHVLEYSEDAQGGTLSVSDRMTLSGKTATVTVWYQPAEGASRQVRMATATVTLDAADIGGGETAWSGEHERSFGQFAPGGALPEGLDAPPRTATVTFPELSGGDMQVVSVLVECADEDGEPCQCVLCGYSLGLTASSSARFTDEYKTPDMSLTPPSDGEPFASSGDFPACVGIYQQRLVFAASRNQPSTFWMSATGDLYTFTPHESMREDDALEATLAATEFPDINHVVMGHDLMMFGDGGEWRISPASGNTITYKTLSAMLQSRIGCAKWLKPIEIGGEVVFAERTGATVRSIAYSYMSDGYDSTDLTVLAGGMFAGNPIRRMCYKQHPDSTVECVLEDGTIATLVYMKEHEVVAWSHHTLGGGRLAKDVATSKALDGTTTDVVLTVGSAAGTELWTVRPDPSGAEVAVQACLDGARTMSGAEAQATGVWLEGWVAVDLLTGETLAAADALDAERLYIVGFPIRSELVTVRPEPGPQDSMQFEIKNAKTVSLRTVTAGRMLVAPFCEAKELAARPLATLVGVANGEVAIRTDDTRATLFGANSGDGRVRLVHEDVWPMQLLRIEVDYEVQPLANAAG